MISVRRIISWGLTVYLLMMLVSLGFVLVNSNATQNALTTDRQAEMVSEGAMSLLLLSSELEFSKSSRIQRQWNAKVSDLYDQIDAIQTLNHVDGPILQRLRDMLKDADEDMQRLMIPGMLTGIDPQWQQHLSGRNGEAIRNQDIFNMTIKLHRLLTLTNGLSEVVRKEINRATSQTNIVIIGLLLVFILLTFAFMLFIKQFVNQPIAIIEQSLGGDNSMDVSVPTLNSEEFDRIGLAINQSFSQLKTMTVSRDRLADEVNERQKAEQKALQALTELRETQQRMLHVEKLSALGTFVGGVAHEMNNPLMGISNYIDFVQRKLDEGKPRDMLERAAEEVERLTRIVKNLLIYARSGTVEDASCDASEVIERVLSVLGGRIRKEDVELSVDIDPGPIMVSISSDSLQQVIMNLMVNAMDAVLGQPQQQINIYTDTEDDQFQIHVSDSGVGIDPEVKSKIFDPFFTTKPVGQGTGLGLSISAQLANDAGGLLWINDEPAHSGAEFILRLKRKPPR